MYVVYLNSSKITGKIHFQMSAHHMLLIYDDSGV